MAEWEDKIELFEDWVDRVGEILKEMEKAKNDGVISDEEWEDADGMLMNAFVVLQEIESAANKGENWDEVRKYR